jgi:serine/threonine-protein kinase
VPRPREDRIGRYELLIELGHGGMAELFLGRLHGAGGFAKLVAIKRILPHLAKDAEFTAMFLDEGRIASRLSHPNVCQVFELDDAEGDLFLAMEYLDGVGWDRLLAETNKGIPPLELAAGVLAQAADGLHYAHTLRDIEGNLTPIVHRDVSPQNLFVTVDGVCKVLDFGVSKMMTDGPRTKSGVVKGKLPYMAPEQIRGEPVDARTDVFSLGVCLWEALAHDRLYDRATDFLIWKAVTEEDAPLITTRWPKCPVAVEGLIKRALAREPSERIASAREFAEELRAAVPQLASATQIGETLRAACGEQLAQRSKQVASAISARSSGPIAARATPLERPTPDPSESAAVTMQSGRSAALTMDDKPRALDPGETTDLRSPVRLRDKSHVVERDAPPPPDPTLDHLEVAAEKHNRIGLIIGGIAAALVLVVVIVVATRGSSTAPSTPPGNPPAPAITPDAAVVSAVDAAVPVAVDAAPVAIAVDAAVGTPPRPDPKPHVEAPKVVPKPKPVEKPKTDPFGTARPGDTKPDKTKDLDDPFATPGSLSITSDPYATIYLDGKKLGDTPLFRAKVPYGKWTLKAVLADGREKSFPIEIVAGKEYNAGKLTW